jgi:phosphohistidine phosphatase
MRQLILMRHAKSSWSEPDQRDLDRPLNKRGRRSAALIAAWLKSNRYRPDHALVSNARRTQETWSRIVEKIGGTATTHVPELYQADPAAILTAVQHAPDVERLLVLGHQPGIGGFARLVLETAPDDAAFAKFPTGATAVIDFDATDLRDITLGSGRLRDFVVPRTLG